MNLTRSQKNKVLISVNLVFAILLVYLNLFTEFSLGTYLIVWMFIFPFIFIAHLTPSQSDSFTKARDIGLFLLTGSAIGKIIASLIKNELNSTSIIFTAWLVLALIAAAIHYSPSDKDRYLN